ncbi:uncharacterized protein LOC106713336 [Papilio machaon]|uniref:uncharacterized protein LOC106713336 n=1 Tax=Papilio machaon TaxID=76193 RepID=UPI001E662B03|nr:uncharacterized protein LOC106713336 [Papilio machaon]
MKIILLIAVIQLLTFIVIDGSPLPKEEKSEQEGKESEKNIKTEATTAKDVETEKDNDTKLKSAKGRNEKSTPEPVIEEEENQFYIMVPAGKQAQNFKPFNFKRIPKMPVQPKYVFKQPNYPTLPYAYPMFQGNQELMEPETEIEYSVPNMMTKMTDNLPMYYIPLRKGQLRNDADDMTQMYQSPFLFQDKEMNPWDPYLENPGYYK